MRFRHFLYIIKPRFLSKWDRIYLQGVRVRYDTCNYTDEYHNFNDQYIISKISKNDKTGNIDIEFLHNKKDFINVLRGTYSGGGTIGKLLLVSNQLIFYIR